ncbi:MAG: chaperone NapD [Candidatus Marinimicrobia bacterium]|nr:chaperone NapD [Candidatus Neomarinimicrobiota bacterium]
MPIAGLVIMTKPDKADEVLDGLKQVPGITTYGIHKDNHIVAVLETSSIEELKVTSLSIMDDIPNVMGVYPSSVNYEDLEDVDE